MPVTILHTADLHLGRGFGQFDPEVGARLRRQRIKTLQAIAELAAAEQVDAVMVAGDIFDNAEPSDETLYSLQQAAEPFPGPWVLLPGNHDPALVESVWTRIERMRWKGSWHLALTGDPILLADGQLAVLPAPVLRKNESEDITATWDTIATPAGAFRVGLGHGSVPGHSGAGDEVPNPIATDRAQRARLDYLALGDWHGTLRINARAWYSGTPEPDSFDDNGTGNVLLVTLTVPGSGSNAEPVVEPRCVAHHRWTRIEATLTTAADLDLLATRLQDLGPAFDRQVVWLQLTGALDLASQHRLEELVPQWSARFDGALRLDRAQLVAEPSDADLDAIATGGFVRQAIDDLRRRLQPAHPERDTAAEALRLLYTLDRRKGAST